MHRFRAVKLSHAHSPNAFADMLKDLINVVPNKGVRENIRKYCIRAVSMIYFFMVLDA